MVFCSAHFMLAAQKWWKRRIDRRRKGRESWEPWNNIFTLFVTWVDSWPQKQYFAASHTRQENIFQEDPNFRDAFVQFLGEIGSWQRHQKLFLLSWLPTFRVERNVNVNVKKNLGKTLKPRLLGKLIQKGWKINKLLCIL